MSPRTDSPLTPKVRRLVERDRLSRPPVGRLSGTHIEALSGIATRRTRHDADVSAPRAIAALATGAPEQAIPVIKIVLEDSSAPQPDQVAAARALGAIANSAAERLILRQVARAEPRVQQELLTALGTFGSARTAAALTEELFSSPDMALQRQLTLTRALIAHHHGLDGPFLPPHAAAEKPRGRRGDLTKVELSTKTGRALAADLQRLKGSSYGISFAERGFRLRCGPSDWTMFLNEALGTTPTLLAPLFESRPGSRASWHSATPLVRH